MAEEKQSVGKGLEANKESYTPFDMNIKNLDIDQMLEIAEVASGVLRVVYNLQEIEVYSKDDAAQDLIDFLSEMTYLEGIERFKGRVSENE